MLRDGKRVNACLTLAVMCDGAELTTIEGLADGDQLHPMQQAFIQHDAFQCGYCTPGQICSAIGLVNEGRANDRAQIQELMSGNLCRCGAYNNIRDAIEDALPACRRQEVSHEPFHYSRPTEVQQAVQMSSAASRFIAGGTNLLDLMKENISHPEHLIDITGLPLHDIQETAEGGLRIGALVSNADLAWHPLIEQRYPLLSQAILAGASPQLRNMASTGGNLCSAPVAITSTTPRCRATNASPAAAARRATV